MCFRPFLNSFLSSINGRKSQSVQVPNENVAIAKPQLQCPYWNLKALNRSLDWKVEKN
jgi:hypothetical protein